MCSSPPQTKREKMVKKPNKLDFWCPGDLCAVRMRVRLQPCPWCYQQLPWGELTSSRAHTISLTLFYFLLARECWKSSLSWMVIAHTTHTLGRAWPPLATSMMMASQVSAVSSWAISLEIPAGLAALPVSFHGWVPCGIYCSCGPSQHLGLC